MVVKDQKATPEYGAWATAKLDPDTVQGFNDAVESETLRSSCL